MHSTISNDSIIELLKCDMAMALGCTEPIAATLAVVKAREVLGEIPCKVELLVSGNIFKNGSGVGIPGTKMRGIGVAAALGVFTGSSERALEVLEGVNDEVTALAEEFFKSGAVEVKVKEAVDKLYIEAVLSCKNGKTASAIVEKCHTNIIGAFLDGKQVFKAEEKQKSFKQDKCGKVVGLNIQRLYDFACEIELNKLDFVTNGASHNWLISEEGLKNNYGFSLGKTLRKKAISDADNMRAAMARVAAGVDARMSGSILPVMTNSGSGNQGITIYVPIIHYALSQKLSNEELTRALAFGNAVSIHIKKQIGPLSALCGIISASIGAACGIAFLRKGSVKQCENIIKFVIANISGMFCDGAKASCSLKAASGISAAYEALYLAMDSDCEAFSDGILDDCVENSICNLSKIAICGMVQTDTEILNIMLAKNNC